MCLVLGIFPYTVFAYSDVPATQSWNIKNFSANIQVHEDSSVEITENIQADFSREPHHGIIRSIPFKNTDTSGRRSYIRLNIVNITDEKGIKWPYEKQIDGDNIVIKIGDPDIYVQGPATFNIAYTVGNAVRKFDDHDEVYWNATGNQWKVPIKNASTTVILPKNAPAQNLRAICFTGEYGSKEKNCSAKVKDEKTFVFTAEKRAEDAALQPFEGLTIVAGFPKGIVALPTVQKKIFWFLQENWGYFIPLFVFFLLFYQWYTKGRDPVAQRTAIMPSYEPPDNLTPSEVGTIIDERVNIRDINAGIIHLAVRGYLKIIEEEKESIFKGKNYKFILLKKDFQNDTAIQSHEKLILKAIFHSSVERDLSDLNKRFYENIPRVEKDIYSKVVEKGYFSVSPDTVRGKYTCLSMAIFTLAFFSMLGIIIVFSFSVFVGIIISAGLIGLSGRYMPAKTKKGVETYIKLLGLKEYINTAEKDRLKFQEKENIFEKLLPYAMALGIANKWGKTFEGIYKTPPSWYQSNNPNFLNNFSTLYFLDSLNGLSSNMESTFTSKPGSSGLIGSGSGFGGGGFSGGGGGGGGGGGW